MRTQKGDLRVVDIEPLCGLGTEEAQNEKLQYCVDFSGKSIKKKKSIGVGIFCGSPNISAFYYANIIVKWRIRQ